MKRKQNDIKIGEALTELLDTYKLNGKLNEIKIIEGWKSTLGTMINNHTKTIKIQNGKLFVKLDNAALKNELSYSKTKLIKSLNEYVGVDVIQEIIIS